MLELPNLVVTVANALKVSVKVAKYGLIAVGAGVVILMALSYFGIDPGVAVVTD